VEEKADKIFPEVSGTLKMKKLGNRQAGDGIAKLNNLNIVICSRLSGFSSWEWIWHGWKACKTVQAHAIICRVAMAGEAR
jgi:hypothetical protein